MSTLQVSAEELRDVRIYDGLGREVTQRTKQRFTSDESIVIDISKLAPGVYTVRTPSTTNKVIKE